MGLGGSPVGRALDYHAPSPGLDAQHHTDRVWRCVLLISAFWEVRGKEQSFKVILAYTVQGQSVYKQTNRTGNSLWLVPHGQQQEPDRVLKDYGLYLLPPGTSLLGVWTWILAGQEKQEDREVAWFLRIQQA